MNIVVMGPPGSGKSTQAKLLAQELSLPYLEVSQVLSAVAKTKNGLGKLVKESMTKGKIVDESLTLMAVESHLQNPWFKKGFILDGFLRTLWQAKNFKKQLDVVFYVKVKDKVNIERLLTRGRKDDTLAVIKRRLKEYHRRTEPVLGYYRKKEILQEVDGERPIEEIHRDIISRLKI